MRVYVNDIIYLFSEACSLLELRCGKPVSEADCLLETMQELWGGGCAGGAAELLFLLLVLIFILTRVRGFRNRSFMMGNTVQCVMTPGTFRMLTLCVGC